MSPPSREAEIQKTVEETANADRGERETQTSNAAAQIAAAINALTCAQNTQTSREDRSQKINTAINITVIVVASAAAIFAGLSWWAFRDQLRVSQSSDNTFKETLVAANQAWIAPRTVYLNEPLAPKAHASMRVMFDNPGHEPALNTELRTQVLVVTSKAVDAALVDINLWEKFFGRNTACDVIPHVKGTEPYWPSPPERYMLRFGTDKDDPIVSDGVLNGSESIITNGCIFYETFKEIHFSKFCFLLRQIPPHVLGIVDPAAICPAGNDAN